ncbi:MAG: replication-associated recombination protein A [Planctomycetes bacterium]|nr:replication-associated recombination protein A [Planctomycetota bacterium]
MDLFAEQEQAALGRVQPLAVRMRPRALDEFVGQELFLGPGKLLRRLLEADRLTSAIFYGPPGSGKSTLARIIANHTRAAFETLHAAEAGVKDVRRIIEQAKGRLTSRNQRTVLFLDEIHRFNRAQQDTLLRDVEEGTLILLGATTENPFHSVNAPLISRSNIFEFTPLTADQLISLMQSALHDKERGLGNAQARVDDDALRLIAEQSNGDARRALSALEVAVLSQEAEGQAPHVTVAVAAESMQRSLAQFDKAGDTHYDVASAFIKSMRGSDPDAALYWLARMLEGGEDPRFIARRIAICASEDVGNADPQAVVLAAAAAQVTGLVGLPECEYALAQATVYVACAPKSNAVTKAIAAAREDVRTKPILPVPRHLRDASYAGAARLGRGQDYVSPHETPDGFLPQDYLGAVRRYYNPTERGEERRLLERLRELRKHTRPPGPRPDQRES